MASFTDQLQPFTPYVEQFPVQAALQVGLQKQAQYNQGIERIQSQIDTIAGLDVVRDVDKQYLQSKLNTLGGNLKKVAAGDFSNFQLTNSVGGMIGQIGKDPNIQNAVSSTMKYRKGITEMEAARKEGKSSPSNEWDFTTQANRWLSSTNPSEAFSGGYNPYSDWRKHSMDVIKALTKSEDIRDDAFTVDSKGNLVIADATVRKRLAGIPPEQIQTALMAALSPADFKQMEIDGRYSYSNTDPAQLAQRINSSYNDKITFYTKQKKALEDSKSSTTSNIEKSKLDDKITALDNTIRSISSDHAGIEDLIISGNIEAVKARLYTSDAIGNFSRAFSFTETSQTYQGKTLQEMNMWRADKEQRWKEFITRLGWDKEEFALKFAQKERELAQKDQELGGFGGRPREVEKKDLPEYTLQKVIADTESLSEEIEKADANFIDQNGKNQEWLDKQRLDWEKNPYGVDTEVADHFNVFEEKRRTAEANRAMIDDIDKKGVEKFGTIKDLIPKGNNVTYTSPQGVSFTYTPEDFVNYNENSDKYIIPGIRGPVGAPGTVIFDLEAARRELSPKEFHLFQIQSGSIKRTESTDVLFKLAQEYNKAVNIPYEKKVEEINKFTAKEVSERVTVSQGVSHTIPAGNTELRKEIATVLTDYADLAESQKGKIAKSEFDKDAARKIAMSPNATYSITVVEGTEYQDPMYIINATGGTVDSPVSTQLRLTSEQKVATFGSMFEATPALRAFRPYQQQIRKMGGRSTALSPGTSSHENAFLGKRDFPRVEIYGVKANINKSSASGLYSIRLSVYDPIKEKWFENIPIETELLREDQVIPMIVGLKDADVFELINEVPPTAQDLKRVKEATKKP